MLRSTGIKKFVVWLKDVKSTAVRKNNAKISRCFYLFNNENPILLFLIPEQSYRSVMFTLMLFLIPEQPYRSVMFTLIGFVFLLLILLVICVILLKRKSEDRTRELFWHWLDRAASQTRGKVPSATSSDPLYPRGARALPPHSWRDNLTADRF